MELLNATKMQAGYTMGMEPSGRELIVVVVKGTFALPSSPAEEPLLAPTQIPIVEADTFTGEPGYSAPIYEADYSPVKKLCDVVVLGSAYAPGAVPAQIVPVSLNVRHANGRQLLHKEFHVVGNRRWASGLLGTEATYPELFTSLPISYDVASGGFDNLNEDPSRHEVHPANPIGRGFFPRSQGRPIDGKPLPNTEQPGQPISDPRRLYTPMGFGPIGRSWQPRIRYAGTYDQNWVDNVFPFLPADFDDRYYQCVPEDQQIPHLQGGEEITLTNVTPSGHLSFRLPALDVPITFFYKNYEEKEFAAAADTLVIEPDLNRFTITWRTALPIKRNIFEVAQAVAGRMPGGWYRARKLGKTYYPSVKALADSKREEMPAEESVEETEESPA